MLLSRILVVLALPAAHIQKPIWLDLDIHEDIGMSIVLLFPSILCILLHFCGNHNLYLHEMLPLTFACMGGFWLLISSNRNLEYYSEACRGNNGHHLLFVNCNYV